MRSVNPALVNEHRLAQINHDIAIVKVIRIQADHLQVQMEKMYRNILKKEAIHIAVGRVRTAIADMDDPDAEIALRHGIGIEDNTEKVDQTLDSISIMVETKTATEAIIEIEI